MTSLEIIRSKQKVNKAVEDHAEAVRQRIEEEDSAKFAPLKKIYDEVKHLPAKYRARYSNQTPLPPTLEGMWEDSASSHHISFWSNMGNGGWNLLIEKGVFNNRDHHDSRTTENAEEAKSWLVEKLATLLADEEAN